MLAFQGVGGRPFQASDLLWVTSMALYLESCNLIPDHTGAVEESSRVGKTKTAGFVFFCLGIKGFFFQGVKEVVSSTFVRTYVFFVDWHDLAVLHWTCFFLQHINKNHHFKFVG